VFLICATGKTAAEMLSALQQRIVNDAHTELLIAAGEQAKICSLRLVKLVLRKIAYLALLFIKWFKFNPFMKSLSVFVAILDLIFYLG